MARLATSIRITATARALIKAMSAELGLSQSGVIELAVRKLARHERITVKPRSHHKPKPQVTQVTPIEYPMKSE